MYQVFFYESATIPELKKAILEAVKTETKIIISGKPMQGLTYFLAGLYLDKPFSNLQEFPLESLDDSKILARYLTKDIELPQEKQLITTYVGYYDLLLMSKELDVTFVFNTFSNL
jgi:hypothetical protein